MIPFLAIYFLFVQSVCTCNEIGSARGKAEFRISENSEEYILTLKDNQETDMDSILFRLNHAEKYLLAGIIEIHDVVEVTCQPYDDGFEVQVFTAGKGSINLLHKIKLTGIPRQVEFIKAR